MGDLNSLSALLADLKSQTQTLLGAARDLGTLLDIEETRLNREDEVASLRAVHSAVVERLQRLKETESSTSSGHSQAKLLATLAGAVTTAIVSKGNILPAIADYLCWSSTGQEPFGLVMVYVGPEGLPDNAGAICVSELARETGLPQPETMSRIRTAGYLLFTQEAFSLLIGRLVDEVRAGRLRLPIPRDVLLGIPAWRGPESEVKIVPLD